MIDKKIKCPKCNTVSNISGNPGQTVKVTCPNCGVQGKFPFPAMSSNGYAIEVFNLRKEYGELIAVNDISFKVKKGEIFAFLGPNGAGKTTTVEMIESIRIPTAGNIRILGYDVSKEFNLVKEKIGILPQEFKSFEKMTVRETLEYFSMLYKKRANIDEIINSMNLQDQQKKLYKDLSGGLKQRVGVAISLVNDPDIVFLDEPSTGLDPKARREVWEVIASLKEKGKTVFLTTHYMEEAEYLADHIIIIHKGKIIAEGSLEELIGKHGKGSTLRIKSCKSKQSVINSLKDAGFDAHSESNGDIAVVIEFKEKVLEVLSILKHECVDYDSIDIRQSNLEEIFLKLTGAKLREAS
jgi:ABC-2 type transport system ATP-binding protein